MSIIYVDIPFALHLIQAKGMSYLFYHKCSIRRELYKGGNRKTL